MDLKKALEELSHNEGQAAKYKGIEATNAAFRRTHENKAEEIRDSIFNYMIENGVQKDTVDMGIVNFVLTVNEGKESVDCPDLEAVPEAFIRLIKEADKKAIGEHLKTNEVNWASIKKGNSYLTIKASNK